MSKRSLFDDAVGRRELLRAGTLGLTGLAAAALIGCGDDDDDDDVSSPVAGDDTGSSGSGDDSSGGGDDSSGNGGGEEYANADLVALNDPSLPYNWVIPEPKQDPTPGGTFSIGNDQDFAQFDPTRSTSGTVTTQLSMVTDRLLSFRGGANMDPFKVPELEPKLARSWEVSSDGLTYTFDITDQAKFHNKPPVNGRQLVAEDVKLVLERYASEGVHVANFEFVDSFEAPDDTTLIARMSAPNPDWLVNLGSRYNPIYPIELVDEGLIETELIGTGPYLPEELVKGDHMYYVRNDEYWDSPSLVDRVEFRVIPDRAAQIAGLRAGQWHYAQGFVLENYTAAKALEQSNPDMQFWLVDLGAPTWGLALNLSNPMFQDPRVRRAIMMLVDRELMSDVLYEGYAEQSATAPWFFAFDEKPTPESGVLGPWWRYDPAEATKLLQAAESEGLGFNIVWSREEAPVEFFIEALRQGGLDVQGEQTDFTTLAAQWNQKEYAEALYGYSTGGFTADSRFRGQLTTGSGINRWQIDDSEINGWAAQQASMLDEQERREVLRQIWDKVLDQAYRIEAVLPLNFDVVAPGVRNFRSQAPITSISGILGFGDWGPRVWLES